MIFLLLKSLILYPRKHLPSNRYVTMSSISRSYVDVHAHLTHEQFNGEEDSIIEKCISSGLEYIICNGLEPISNRQVLQISERNPSVLPALGIYPLDAACHVIERGKNWNHDFDPPEKFDIEAEVDFINSMADQKKIVAVGECGLDKHYLTDEVSMHEQERVLRLLIKVAKNHDIPIILHTRKAEARVLEMLLEEGVTKADFHCFCGKAKLGQKIAAAGYYLSIPAAVENSSSFQKLVQMVPMEYLLTETDCPYMGPDKGVRNDPSNVVRGVAAIAQVKNLSVDETRDIIRGNFRKLFNL